MFEIMSEYWINEADIMWCLKSCLNIGLMKQILC